MFFIVLFIYNLFMAYLMTSHITGKDAEGSAVV